MGITNLSIKGRDYYINGKPVYGEIEGNSNSKGLLINSRYIQGIFDDKTDRQRYNRFILLLHYYNGMNMGKEQ